MGHRLIKTVFLATLALVAFNSATGQSKPRATELLEPGPELSPQQVVAIQLDALADNDHPLPNAGIATVFRFASPSNREMTGPLDRFTLMVNGEAYRDMINHTASRLLAPQADPTHTYIPVELTTRIGTRVRYVFVLSRQTGGECTGCWMTDGVMPVDREPTQKPQKI